MGALGADFGTLSTNPAGLALFRTDELTVTPGLKFAHTNANLPGNETVEEDKSTFGFDNLGLVFNTTPRASRWKTFNVGLGFNRQSNFNQSIYYTGNSNGSVMNGFSTMLKMCSTTAGLRTTSTLSIPAGLGRQRYLFSGQHADLRFRRV
ncbi:MAG: hypothetical protein IPK76_06865 [Lewinellaceae bacterium]|nr:hypothetical protein [Lewinellaceae bacterium]